MRNKVVLLTGGTGTVGQELAKQILKQKPKKLIIFSRDEYKQYIMRQNFLFPIRYFIGDVRDKERLKCAFKDVDIVIHTAALKHVETGEYNPYEVIQTNVYGAQNIIDAAITCNVKKVLMISSDKAVNPVNLYGATKLCADKLALGAIAYAGKDGTKFACIRPGNFCGSRGSVIEKFRKIHESGSNVYPITHIDMTRFFISVQKAAKLIIKAVELMQGNEIFLPKMQRAQIRDLPFAFNSEANIKLVGVGEGEKLYEEMLTQNDTPYTYNLSDFYVTCKNDIKNYYADNHKKVASTFQYTSRRGTKWSMNELIKLVK